MSAKDKFKAISFLKKSINLIKNNELETSYRSPSIIFVISHKKYEEVKVRCSYSFERELYSWTLAKKNSAYSPTRPIAGLSDTRIIELDNRNPETVSDEEISLLLLKYSKI
jgi:hypothetical protein